MELGKKYPETEFLIFNNQKDADFFLKESKRERIYTGEESFC